MSQVGSHPNIKHGHSSFGGRQRLKSEPMINISSRLEASKFSEMWQISSSNADEKFRQCSMMAAGQGINPLKFTKLHNKTIS